jgi:transcriptional regulator GlxA family with amidase domain
MQLAYVIFDGITWLDFIGVYDPVSRLKSRNYLPDLSWDVCAYTDTVADSFDLQVVPTKVRQPLTGYDVLIVPGGYGTRELQADAGFIDWICTARYVPLKVSVCTGSLILGAAGFLAGKKATTHFSEYEALKAYCNEVSKDRIVADGDVITAGGVSSSIDLGLYLCHQWAGAAAALDIRERMEYRG